MEITSTDKKVRIGANGITTVYPLHSLAYELTANGVSIFTSNNERIYTAPLSQTSVNGEALTGDNADTLLDPLFKSGGSTGGTQLPIQMSDVIGLQSALASRPVTITLSQAEYDALAVKDPNTLYYVY